MDYPSNQDALNMFAVPGSKAHPLNQGQSYLCTCYAIANAAGDQLAEKNIDIDQNTFASILVSHYGSIGPVWPHFYDNYHIPILIKTRDKGKHYYIKIATVSEVKKFSNTDKCVLAYYTETNDYHCVFVKEQLENYYSCVNSWGTVEEFPQVELNKPGNRLWRVRVEFEPAQIGWSSFVICYT